MKASSKKRILCIPGLGGHPSVFREYITLLPEYELASMEFVNIEEALREARSALAAASDPMILFCHCYSAQLGIQLAREMPEKVDRMVFLEPFFQEFHPWMKILRPVNILLLGVSRFLDMLGLRRRTFKYQPDYVALAKYPIYFQPFFDIRWQNLTDYLRKCYDILTYKLPKRVETQTFMLFSPKGFSRKPAIREELKNVFQDVNIMEMTEGTHNVVTMGGVSVAQAIREAINTNKK